MSAAPVRAGSDRDLRLDFFRGLALFSIFLDHIPGNPVSRFTLQGTGILDAAEVFILISGYTAGMVYGGVASGRGMLLATARIYHRVWQLYVAHVFLFVIFMATVAHAVDRMSWGLYAEEFRAIDFLREPGLAVVKALTLQFQPMYMDILPLYIVLLAILPPALLGFRRVPLLVLAGSAALWLWVQIDARVALPAYPGEGHVWYFNPFGWQALFLLGAWLGWRRSGTGTQGVPRPLFHAALAVALAGFAIKTSWMLHHLYEPIPALLAQPLWPYLSKTDLSPVRFANVMALAILIVHLVPPQARFMTGAVARPFLVCGRHSLEIFCLGILLAVLAQMVLSEVIGDVMLQIAMSAAGVAIMIGAAELIDWFGRQGSAKGGGSGAAGASGGRS